MKATLLALLFAVLVNGCKSSTYELNVKDVSNGDLNASSRQTPTKDATKVGFSNQEQFNSCLEQNTTRRDPQTYCRCILAQTHPIVCAEYDLRGAVGPWGISDTTPYAAPLGPHQYAGSAFTVGMTGDPVQDGYLRSAASVAPVVTREQYEQDMAALTEAVDAAQTQGDTK